MKTVNFKSVLGWSGWILLFIVLFFMKTCQPEPSFSKIEIPEKKGKFEGKKPDHVEITPKIIHTKENVYIKGEKVYIANPLNEVLLSENERLKLDFEKANDSIKKLLYDNAISINKFSTTFEDENLLLNIDGIVRGEVQEVTPNYTIKKQTISVPVKQTIFRLLGGVEAGNTMQLNQLSFKANVGFQNKSGDVLNIGYDTQNVIWIGFSKSLFEIKR